MPPLPDRAPRSRVKIPTDTDFAIVDELPPNENVLGTAPIGAGPSTDYAIKYCSECNKPVSANRSKCVSCSRKEQEKTTELKGKKTTTVNERAAKKASSEVESWLGMVQFSMVLSGDDYCAKALNDCGPQICAAIEKICEDFPMVARMISKGDKWSAIAMLFAQIGRLGLMVGVHHGAIPYESLVKWIVPPPPDIIAKAKNNESSSTNNVRNLYPTENPVG